MYVKSHPKRVNYITVGWLGKRLSFDNQSHVGYLANADTLKDGLQARIAFPAIVDWARLKKDQVEIVLGYRAIQPLERRVFVAKRAINNGEDHRADVAMAGRLLQFAKDGFGVLLAPHRGVDVAEVAQREGAVLGELCGLQILFQGFGKAVGLPERRAEREMREPIVIIRGQGAVSFFDGTVEVAQVIGNRDTERLEARLERVEIDRFRQLLICLWREMMGREIVEAEPGAAGGAVGIQCNGGAKLRSGCCPIPVVRGGAESEEGVRNFEFRIEPDGLLCGGARLGNRARRAPESINAQ